MVFIFVLLGGIAGAMVDGVLGAAVGAVALPLLWGALRRQAAPTDTRVDHAVIAALTERVQALEDEVAALRDEVHGKAPAAAAPSAEQAPVPKAQPAIAAAPLVITVPLPPPAPQVPAATEPIDAPRESVTPSTWTAPAPRPAQPPPPPPEPALPLRDRLPPFLSRWIFGGNTIVKVGVLILFLGLAFLLRYAAERVTVPVELRYAGVALAGALLLGIGWRLRARPDASGSTGYGLILQGAGIGVFYLTALAAIKLHPLLTVTTAFAFMAIVAVLGAALAVMQNAPWLALVAVAEGFAAPVLVSTGGGNHIALFSYLVVLDVGIVLMAWFKAWRPLNLVGAVSTFTLGTAWAQRSYTDSMFASVEFFLLLFFVLFTAIAVLFARRALALGEAPDASEPLATRAAQALARVGRVDSTLTFGVPLAAYGLQYLLVRHVEWGPAWGAFGFACFYLALGAGLLRSGLRYALLGETYVIVSVIFATLTVPLALEGVWTGATWAVEAAGMYWLGARQRRVYARGFALLVLAGAVVRLATEMDFDLRPGTPLLTGSVLGLALLAASTGAMIRVQRSIATAQRSAVERIGGMLLPLVAVAALTAIAWTVLVPLWAGALTAWLALACVALALRQAEAVWPLCAMTLYAIALTSLALSLHTINGTAMLANGWQGLAAALLIGTALLAGTWLGLRVRLQAMDASDAAPSWSLPSSLGLLAGVGLLAMSLLFVMPADQAALAWPWLALVALWLGLRAAHPALGLAWFVLNVASAIATVAYGPLLWPADPAAPRAALAFWAPLMLSLTGFIAGDWLQRAAQATRRPSAWTRQSLVQWGIVLWSLVWWANLVPAELNRQLRLLHADEIWPALLVILTLVSSMLVASLAQWRRWRVLGQATVLTLPLWVVAAAIGPLGQGTRPSAEMGWLAWPLALAWHLALLRVQKAWWERRLAPLHVLGFWFFLLLAAREGQLAMESLGAPGSAWSTLGFMLVPALVLALVTRPAVQARWPLSEWRSTYLWPACAPVALYLLLWLWVGNTQSGAAAPLPYVPLLNPLELGQALVLLALMLWWRAVQLPREPGLAIAGVTLFALYTGLVLRAAHHGAGVPWSTQALFDSTLTQAALSVAWSVVGVGVMLLGHRRTTRGLWMAGAVLLGVVVAKLFLVELADRGGLYRIVSFIVVGVLLLVVGYFAPMPPKRAAAAAPAGAA